MASAMLALAVLVSVVTSAWWVSGTPKLPLLRLCVLCRTVLVVVVNVVVLGVWLISSVLVLGLC